MNSRKSRATNCGPLSEMIRGWAANVLSPPGRRAAEADRLTSEIGLLREELRTEDTRLAKIDPRRRPYYPSVERVAILQLKAARANR
jgi:hypothetical protein